MFGSFDDDFVLFVRKLQNKMHMKMDIVNTTLRRNITKKK